MNIESISGIKSASGLVSLTGSTSAPEFNRAIKEIAASREVEPYFFQEGRFERIAGKGYSVYVLVPHERDGSPFVNSFHVPENKLAQEISVFANEPGEETVLILDGGNYDSETLTTLDKYERTFVLFPPYDPKQTVHITEAKRQLWRNVFRSRQGSSVDRVSKH